MIRTIRHWLLRKLAGDMTVAINLRYEGSIFLRAESGYLLSNVVCDGSSRKAMEVTP